MTASSPVPVGAGTADGPWTDAQQGRRCGRYERHAKRTIDLVGGTALLVILSPVLVVLAIAIRIRLGSPVFFRQTRIGRHGVPFDVLKFRSMSHDRRRRDGPFGGHDRRRVHKTSDDPRHTTLGRRIRRLSLDELPQLLNVVRGQMSLVGPRPELAHVAEEYDLVDHPRHVVRPGITGLWQVSPHRDRFLYENTEKDLEYIDKVTFVGDVKILLRTVVAVGKGS